MLALRFNVRPDGQVLIPVEVDYSLAFPGADHEAWAMEYSNHIEADYFALAPGTVPRRNLPRAARHSF